ncbi:MAG: oligopeptide/dipeptide ABC transporter ATP-binding protein [Devosia sp.]
MGLLFISHDLAIVRTIADVTTVMYLGKVVESGPSAALWRSPVHPYTESLIGAIPRPDGAGRLPLDLPGDVPNPARPPSGCRFHPRCPVALPACAQTEPLRAPVLSGRTVACLRAQERVTAIAGHAPA